MGSEKKLLHAFENIYDLANNALVMQSFVYKISVDGNHYFNFNASSMV